MSGEAKARGKGKGKGQFSKKGKGDRMEEEMNGIGNGEFQPSRNSQVGHLLRLLLITQSVECYLL